MQGLADFLCGSCVWHCIGDVCGASDCNEEDYSGNGQPDCRCDLCAEEVPNTVFNTETCRCEGQIVDEVRGVGNSGSKLADRLFVRST